MTDAVFSFLPWLRRGLSASIATPATGSIRARVHVDLKATGTPRPGQGALEETVGKDIELYGPGDIIGLQTKALIRTEPKNWTVNVEPNYLALAEFYDEDFPWRYSPTVPTQNGAQLLPWLALIVLAEGEFVDAPHQEGRPLPAVEVGDQDLFPVHADLWAWAHVHLNGAVVADPAATVSTGAAANAAAVQTMLNSNPDLGYSRLLSPRRLEPNRGYHAFLMPSFETGRLSGLGRDPAVAGNAESPGWGPASSRPLPTLHPYYHRWFFRTGAGGDFEQLVKLLKPVTLDAKVGARPIDVQFPGPPLPGILDAGLDGVLRLGGALRVPGAALSPTALAERTLYEKWDNPKPHPFQVALSTFINLEDDYKHEIAANANGSAAMHQVQTNYRSPPDSAETGNDFVSADPIIVAPLYGRWHAAIHRLLVQKNGSSVPNRGNWLHELNLDPAHRVTAAAGTKVIQDNQEDYMRIAWEQVGDVITANRKLRQAQFAAEVSQHWFDKRIKSIANDSDRILRLTWPAQARILSRGKTAAFRLKSSPVPNAVLSNAASRALRVGGRFARNTMLDSRTRNDMLSRMAIGDLRAAPLKAAPASLSTLGSVVQTVVRMRSQVIANPLQSLDSLNEALSPIKDVHRFIEKLDIAPDFSVPGKKDKSPVRDGENPEQEQYKKAFGEWLELMSAHHAAGQRPAPKSVDVGVLTTAVVAALEPRPAIRRWVLSGLALPPGMLAAMPEQFDEIWHHPVIDKPMYEPLKMLSDQFLLPNLGLVPENSISLLETNQKFIESYMVGLNHEFARELLWREYPTDQRGSVFRQFWDVRSQVAEPDETDEAFRERVRDIKKIHFWSKNSVLGDHDNREPTGGNDENAVLSIRGELLKRYPNTAIYAQRAAWQIKNGLPDLTEPRRLVDLEDSDFETMPRSKLRFPIYEARAEPDIRFLGFDLAIAAAKGGDGLTANSDPGWFFVIKERPGEPRFGLDDTQSTLRMANDLSWHDAMAVNPSGKFLPASALNTLVFQVLPVNSALARIAQRDEDARAALAAPSSARWAYLLYQAPVMIAIHAAEMLKSLQGQ